MRSIRFIQLLVAAILVSLTGFAKAQIIDDFSTPLPTYLMADNSNAYFFNVGPVGNGNPFFDTHATSGSNYSSGAGEPFIVNLSGGLLDATAVGSASANMEYRLYNTGFAPPTFLRLLASSSTLSPARRRRPSRGASSATASLTSPRRTSSWPALAPFSSTSARSVAIRSSRTTFRISS
jgi:hypothetical protein